MDEDLLDRRGRLIRLAAAAGIGGAITFGVLHLIRGVAREPNPDAISQASPIFLGIVMFVVTSYLVFSAINAIRRRRAGN